MIADTKKKSKKKFGAVFLMETKELVAFLGWPVWLPKKRAISESGLLKKGYSAEYLKSLKEHTHVNYKGVWVKLTRLSHLSVVK